MPRNTVWLAAAAAVLLASTNLFAQSSNSQKIKEALLKIGIHGDVTVVRADGQWFYGSVEQVDDTSFTIYEIDQKQRVNFSYDQVKKIYKGYGDGAALHRDISGHRIPPSRRHLGWIIAGAGLAALLIAVAVGLRKD